MMKRIYMDYSATTPMDPRILPAMKPYFSKKFGNTMSLHKFGQDAKFAVEEARGVIANFLKADSSELIFTGSATESDNMAIKGTAFANRKKGNHIIISAVEHPAVMEPAHWLKTQGFEITVLPVDRYGLVDPKDVKGAIKDNTIMVSVMHANNEIGTIEPIGEIGKICSDHGVIFHTDATQSFGKLPIDVRKMNIDILTANAHKMYGPKGVGALYVRKGISIEPLLHGGGHEFGLRSSTTNVPSIVGFGAAVKLREKEMAREAKEVTNLRDRLIEGLMKIEHSHLNGHPRKRLPNNANFWFSFIEGESLLLQLDGYGLAGSTGSACSSQSLEPSHVLLAIGLKHEEAHGSLRLSLGKWSTRSDVDYAIGVVPKAVERLRKISPFKPE